MASTSENLSEEKPNAVVEIVRGLVRNVGFFALFAADSVRWWFRKPYRFGEMIRQMEFIGNKSIFIIFLTGTFTGMVFAFQVYQGFRLVSAGNLVGSTTALGICRELGPVLTGLIVAARAGGAMAARLGTMRVTEQIDALEVMAVNPIQYLISPRIVASVLALPLLVGIFDIVAIIGAYMVSVNVLMLDQATFIDKTVYYLDPKDINQGLIKSAFFGLIFSTVCTFKGFHAEGGARGVGNATNEGVVLSMVIIIVSDYFLTNILTFLSRIL